MCSLLCKLGIVLYPVDLTTARARRQLLNLVRCHLGPGCVLEVLVLRASVQFCNMEKPKADYLRDILCGLLSMFCKDLI